MKTFGVCLAGCVLAASAWAQPATVSNDSPGTVAEGLKKTTERISALQHQAAGEISLDAQTSAEFHAGFDRAVALYTNQPDDAAAVQGLSYVFFYCSRTSLANAAKCRETKPGARQQVLRHAESQDLLGILTNATDDDLDFMRTLLGKITKPQMKAAVADRAGERWIRRFYDPTLSKAEHERAYRMTLEYGEILAKLPGPGPGPYAEIYRWKGEGLKSSVQTSVVGRVMPDHDYHALSGEPVALKEYRGKVLLLDFWATWCVPCVASMPHIKTFRDEMAGKPFEVISINAGDPTAKALSFQRKKVSMPWVNWRIEPMSAEYFKLGLTGLPMYFVLGPDGTILLRTSHFDDAVQQRIRAAVAEVK